MIVEYTLEANGTVPTYIVDGGYFLKSNENNSPQDWDMVGHTVNDDVPESLTVLNKAALITRLTNLSWKTFNHGTGEYADATEEEIENYVDAFISKND